MNNFRGMYQDGYLAQPAVQPNNMYSMYQMPQTQPMYRPTPQNYPVIVGKMVGNLNDIRPNEVPNDGSISVFPQSDGACIYVKYLSGDGRINTVKYVAETPEIPNVNQNGTNDQLATINERLTSIEKILSKQGKKPYHGKPYQRKEGAVNDSSNEQSDDR